MKILYYLRVVVLSWEFVLLFGGFILIGVFPEKINAFAPSLNVNNDMLKLLMFVPIALLVWSAKQYQELFIGENKDAKALINWPDFWKIKAVFYVALTYGLVFCIFAVVSLLTENKTLQGSNLIIFAGTCLGSFIVAGSIYFARIHISELFLKD